MSCFTSLYSTPNMQALVYNVTTARWILCKAAGCLSKQAFFGCFSPLKLQDRPIPELPGPGWVRLKTILGGICGTDLALITQQQHPATILQNYANFPAVLGHENVAIIDEVGSEVSSKFEAWKPGRRVCVEPAPGCHAHQTGELCPHCLAGRTSLCEHAGGEGFPPRTLIGLNKITGGSWGQFFLAHHTQLHAVPESLADDTAILVDPIASATHAVLRRLPRPGRQRPRQRLRYHCPGGGCGHSSPGPRQSSHSARAPWFPGRPGPTPWRDACRMFPSRCWQCGSL